MSAWTALRDSVRSFTRTPSLTGALLLTIALGLGSNAAVHGFIRGLAAAQHDSQDVTAVPEVLRLLMIAAAAVFVMACANVAAFLLVRAIGRTKDTCVRVALGANRRQLLKHVLADSVLIAVAGGALGLLLAQWTVSIIPALFFESDAEQLVFAAHQRGVVAIAAACLIVTIACGLMPLIEIRRDNPGSLLQREQLGASPASRRLIHAMVIVQLTCCSLLVTSAGVLSEGFRAALQTAIGEHVGDAILATVEARPHSTRAASATHGLEYFREVEQQARVVPGILASVWAARPPGSRPVLQSLQIVPREQALRDATLDVSVLTSHSLAEVKLPPVAGRMFGGADTADACPVVIVNEAAARELFDDAALGRSIEDPSGKRVEVVGVVATRPRSENASDRPTAYYYGAQGPPPLGRIGPARFRIPERADRRTAVLDTNIVSAGYFDVLGLQPLAGELFSTAMAAHTCRVGIIDSAAADHYFDGDAVGGALIDGSGRRTTIVGVVQPMTLRHWQRSYEPGMYLPMTQDFVPRMTLLLTAEDIGPQQLTRVQQRLTGVSGGTGEVRVATLDAHLSRTALAPERIATVLVTAAAATALVLGLLGAYGVLADSARLRRREIALRLALGAPRWHVLQQVVGTGLRLGVAGAAGALICTPLVTPWLSRAVGSTAREHVFTWLAGPLALVALIIVACLVPMRRALSVDPAILLREQ
jgi:MacB-like periplasmic core domain/FtsX-like permease family